MKNFRSDIFQYLGPLTWKGVFDMWKKDDTSQPSIETYYQSKGFHSWEDWSNTYTQPLKCADANWHLYEIFRPEKNVPNFYGGPFKEWVDSFYEGKDIVEFSELVKSPSIRKNKIITDLVDDFPKGTVLIGLIANGKIVILEGMHRCCALALINEKKDVISGKISIALAEYTGGKLPIVG